MKTKSLHSLMALFIGLAMSLSSPACVSLRSELSQAAGPAANLTSPQNGSTLIQGQETLITFNAADIKGIAQVELSIDGQPVMVEKVTPPVNSYTASYRWLVDKAGPHVIEFQAFNIEQVASPTSQISVIAVEAVGGPTTTAIPEATSTPTMALDTPTVPPPASPIPPPTPTATVDAAANQPTVTMLTGLNVRSGPGTDYPVIGRLGQGETARITGRNELSTWWQIEYLSNQGNRGWVSGGSQYSTATNTGGVAVVQAPPPPVAPTATPSPTSALLKPTIYTFTADRYTIAKGESVTLNWDLANAKAAFLRYDDVEEGVVSPGRKTVSPEKDTKYRLIARNDAGETTAELSITVGGATATPVPILRDGKIRIANGQSVDFDQGLVSADPGGGADFLWNGQQRQFQPRNGAAGALLGRVYGNITLDDCLVAEYNKPIGDLDGSSRVTGCYITDEDRYGKFYISEWDLAGNLTIEWLTWNYKED